MNGKTKAFEYLDDEEKDLIESAEAHFDSPDYKPPTPEEVRALNAEWQARLAEGQQRKPVTLRLQARDIERLKAIAARKGMPYQTLVASVLHQFVNGDLVER